MKIFYVVIEFLYQWACGLSLWILRNYGTKLQGN